MPCIIVSPWTAGGWVCSQPFDHTSVLQFLEKFTGVGSRTSRDWRRKTFGDLTSAFRFEQPASAPRLPDDTAGQLAEAQYEVANLPKPTLPGATRPARQELGRRKRR